MKILTVVPISKGIFKDNLSYFTTKDAKSGSIVIVQVRKKNVPAVVISSSLVKQVKSDLKKSEFSLKPIKSVISDSLFRPEFIEACQIAGDYFISPLGLIIKDFIPIKILELDNPFYNNKKEENGYHGTSLLQMTKKERVQNYKSIIREEFAKGKSVFFCLPTLSDINKFSNELQKGIEKYSFIMHGNLSGKKIKEVWIKSLKEKHPVLIIATKSFFSLPRKDISTIILENESSPFYKSQTRPFIDARKFAEIMTLKIKARLIFGDSIIRTETYYRLNPTMTVSRILSEAEQIIIDMNQETRSWQKTKSFPLISHKLQEIIKETYENKEKIILFVNRRGYYPYTTCNDCMRTLLCEKCETPLVLHKKEGNKNIKFICHKCLKETMAPEKCPHCQSWRLTTLGIGIQKITEEIEKIFPHIKLFRIDSDLIKNSKQGNETIKNFLNTNGSILIGTEILFSYVNQPVERVAVVSLDSLFTLPNFRANEKIFNTILKLRSLSQKTFLIQTRMPDKNIFTDATRGNVSGFYKNELSVREESQYPPFKLLIKITIEGKNSEKLKKDLEKTEKILEKWGPLTYPAFIPKIKNMHIWHILLKIEPLTWPDKQQELRQILFSLQPLCKVDVDPESLL